MLISGQQPVGPTFKATAANAVWSPSTKKRANLHLNLKNNNNNLDEVPSSNTATSTQATSTVTRSVKMSTTTSSNKVTSNQADQDEKSPVWQPFGAPYDGPPQFRPVKLEFSPIKVSRTAKAQNETQHKEETISSEVAKPESPKPKSPKPPKETIESPTQISTEKTPEVHNDEESHLAHSSSATFVKTGWSSHLPPSQSPTITLLQKAREGQLPKGAVYIEEKSESTPIPRNAVLIDQKVTVEGDKVHTDSYYAVPTVTTEVTSHDVKAPPKYDGIGPTEYGIPVGLRTGVKEEYASDWYKTMYKSLHRNKFPNDTNTTVHLGGYMSEPEYERKDKLRAKYEADHRRKPEKTVTYTSQATTSNHQSVDKSRLAAESTIARHEPKREAYRVEPRSIADYEPGRSSLAEREFEKHEHLGHVSPRPHQQGLNRRWPNVLLSDGYESDSTLIRKTGRNPEVDPDQQKAWYKEIQKGGEIPLTGLRKTVPEKPTVSQHQYQEAQVNIHYKTPIRHLEKEYIDEDDFKKIQEDALRKLEEERQKKHQQEMAELEMRRHSDNFTPSQKSPIPLNRYDNPFQTSYGSNSSTISYSRSPLPKTMARTLYPFRSQTTRELSLSKGDIVYINRQIDRNWFEGEHHGLVGIFPVSYVEIIPTEKANLQPRKAIEGEALVKYNFPAQSRLELSLFKGERVILLRKLDHNWYEGRLGTKKGIFPVSYVQVLREPQEHHATTGHRTISPKPTSPILSSLISDSPLKTHEVITYNTSLKPLHNKPPVQSETKSFSQSLHIDTYNEPIPYKSLYSYQPQNEDELELREGDTVYVMEKCDDGWYVGTSLRTGLFGTFPGNYVERM